MSLISKPRFKRNHKERKSHNLPSITNATNAANVTSNTPLKRVPPGAVVEVTLVIDSVLRGPHLAKTLLHVREVMDDLEFNYIRTSFSDIYYRLDLTELDEDSTDASCSTVVWIRPAET